MPTLDRKVNNHYVGEIKLINYYTCTVGSKLDIPEEEEEEIKGVPLAVEHNGLLKEQPSEDTTKEHQLEDDSVTQKIQQSEIIPSLTA